MDGGELKNSGFTVVELVVGLTVFGIMMTVAGPPAFELLRVARHKAIVREYMSMFSVAKSRAVAYRRLSAIHFDEANARVWVEMDTSRSRSGVMDTVAYRDFGGQGVEFAIADGVTKVCYEAGGGRTVANDCDDKQVQIDITLDDVEIRVITTRLGKVLREERRH